MRTYDMTPLFRTSVGFDRLSRFMDTALQLENAGSAYPPYNIIKQNENSCMPWSTAIAHPDALPYARIANCRPLYFR